jgi:hypothetical protein
MSSGIVVSRSLVQQSMIHPNTNQQQPVLTYQSFLDVQKTRVFNASDAPNKHHRGIYQQRYEGVYSIIDIYNINRNNIIRIILTPETTWI